MKRRCLQNLIAALSLAVCAPAFAQGAGDLTPFIGRWLIDPSLSKMGRNGPASPNILRSKTFTFVFTPTATGLRQDVFAGYPQPAPSRSMSLVTDNQRHVCDSPTSCMTAGGSASDQSYAWFEINSHMLAREFWLKSALYDDSTISVSTDGGTMTLISWSPATPQYQNIQVFNRQ